MILLNVSLGRNNITPFIRKQIKKLPFWPIFWVFKGIIHQFWIYNNFPLLNKGNIFYERSISIKPLWLEIIEKKGCTKSVRPSTIIYIIYITRTDFEHHFSQLFRVRVVLSRWTFYKKCFFLLGHERNAIYSKLVNNPFKCEDPYALHQKPARSFSAYSLCTLLESYSFLQPCNLSPVLFPFPFLIAFHHCCKKKARLLPLKGWGNIDCNGGEI